MQPRQKAGAGAQAGCASSLSMAPHRLRAFSLLLCLIVQQIATVCLQEMQ